jgi:hypothetical protein
LIANCGAMGLDWRTLDLSDYLEALEAHNEAADPKAKNEGEPGEPADLDRIRRFHRAHRDGGNRKGAGSVASRPSSGARDE